MKLKKKINRLKSVRFISAIVSAVGFFGMVGVAGGMDIGRLNIAHSAFALAGLLLLMICGVLVMKYCDDEIRRATALIVNAYRSHVRRSKLNETVYCGQKHSSIA